MAAPDAGFRLVYVDECELHSHPHLAKVWQPRGAPVKVPAAGVNQRVPVLGAVDYASGEIVWTLPPAKNGASFVELFEQVAARWPDEVVILVMDTVSYHRGAVMRASWSTQQERLIPFWLPVHTPNLNLMERVWRWLKQGMACHRFRAEEVTLRETADMLLDGVTARFYAPDGPSITLDHNFRQSA